MGSVFAGAKIYLKLACMVVTQSAGLGRAQPPPPFANTFITGIWVLSLLLG